MAFSFQTWVYACGLPVRFRCLDRRMQMPWFAELSPATDFHNTFRVGWLSTEYSFVRGPVHVDVMRRIGFLLEFARTRLTRGSHPCPFCPADDAPLGNGEIRVVSMTGKRYAAPALIGHYIESHHYSPPAEFQAALVGLPAVDPSNAADDQCLACGSGMAKGLIYDDLIRACDRKPVVVTEYYCASCDVKYDREHLIEPESDRADERIVRSRG